MSLLERSQATSLAADEQARQPGGQELETLRAQVQSLVSADDIASLMRENPQQARNEVKSACRRAFAHPRWAAYGDDRRERLVAQVLDGMFGFGPLQGLIADDSITEIMVNGSVSLFYERDGKLYPSATKFSSDDEVRALIDRILGPLGRRIDEAQPMVNARLPQGHRVHAIVPPVAPDGPHLTIRKFAQHVITLQEMQDGGSFGPDVQLFLEWAVMMRKNIAVSGGTGSGKTTLLNALSCLINPTERIVTIEDSLELRFLEHPHVVRLEARPVNTEGKGEITIRDLVINALRMRPDRIVVGECRAGEALDMMQAMNTGHDGSLTTLHANSTSEAITRLATMIRYAAELPIDVIEANIAGAIDVVIQTARAIDGSRYIAEIAGLRFDQTHGHCVVDTYYRRLPLMAQGEWCGLPDWVTDVCRYGFATEEEVRQWTESRCLAS